MVLGEIRLYGIEQLAVFIVGYGAPRNLDDSRVRDDAITSLAAIQ